MVNIAIITAMDSEYNAVKKMYTFQAGEGSERARAYGKSIWLIKSGIGKVNAAIAAERACRLGADLIINTGLAGGIDSSLNQGDIVLATESCYHDVWCGEPNELGQVQDLPLYFATAKKTIADIIAGSPDGYFKTGLVVTGDKFVTEKKILLEIKQNFPKALATDMESAAIAQACYLNRCPYLSLRIISDVVGKEGQIEQYNHFWETIPDKASEMIDIVLKAIPSEDILF